MIAILYLPPSVLVKPSQAYHWNLTTPLSHQSSSSGIIPHIKQVLVLN
jgi:hypothetical protein